jgi:hypothetical protein
MTIAVQPEHITAPDGVHLAAYRRILRDTGV